MKIGIISAMEKERVLIEPMIQYPKKIETSGIEITQGRLNKHEIFLTKCGIGKVNAAINTYKLIQHCHPDLIINTGVAGGASNRTKIGDMLVADYVAYNDVWCGPGTEPGAADGLEVFMKCNPAIVDIALSKADGKRLFIGLICSGDKFITKASEIIEIQSLFPEVLAVDMESASIAQVCSMEGIQFNIIRVISDTPGSGENLNQYQNFWKKAPEKTFLLLESILKEL